MTDKILNFEEYIKLDETLLTVNQTPNVEYRIKINKKTINIDIELSKSLSLSNSETKLLETNMRNMLEIMLSKYVR